MDKRECESEGEGGRRERGERGRCRCGRKGVGVIRVWIKGRVNTSSVCVIFVLFTIDKWCQLETRKKKEEKRRETKTKGE